MELVPFPLGALGVSESSATIALGASVRIFASLIGHRALMIRKGGVHGGIVGLAKAVLAEQGGEPNSGFDPCVAHRPENCAKSLGELCVECRRHRAVELHVDDPLRPIVATRAPRTRPPTIAVGPRNAIGGLSARLLAAEGLTHLPTDVLDPRGRRIARPPGAASSARTSTGPSIATRRLQGEMLKHVSVGD